MFIHSSALVVFVSHFPRLHYLFISTLMDPRRVGRAGDSHHESRGTIVPTHPHGEFTAFEVSGFDEPEKVFGGIAPLEPRFRRVTFKYVRCDL